MEQVNYKKFYPTAIALYFTYFIHGIGASILGQYKQDFASMWGAKVLEDGTFDVSISNSCTWSWTFNLSSFLRAYI